jgi:acetyl-CoA carboxylase biotin carboxyl carrier protein
VANEKSAPPRPFDVKTVEHLIGLMGQHDLAEIALVEGDHRIRLRKNVAPPPVVYAAPPAVAHHAPAPAPAAAAGPAPAAPAGKKLLEIKSEMVGTFYSKPKPDKPDYVAVGAKVKPDTVVCQIEAMKIFNELPAGVSGTVAEACVKNGEFVEYGTVLFRVEPN